MLINVEGIVHTKNRELTFMNNKTFVFLLPYSKRN